MAGMPGRRSKYTPERIEKITTALRQGNTRGASAALGGISIDTFHDWLRMFREFSDAVEIAEAEAEAWNVARIRKAADDGTWTASAWWLERRRYQHWGRKDAVSFSGPNGGAIPVVTKHEFDFNGFAATFAALTGVGGEVGLANGTHESLDSPDPDS